MYVWWSGLQITRLASQSRIYAPHGLVNVGEGEWRLWREGEPFPQRFTGRFEDYGNTIVGRWEKAEDGTNYETDFDLIYRKVK